MPAAKGKAKGKAKTTKTNAHVTVSSFYDREVTKVEIYVWTKCSEVLRKNGFHESGVSNGLVKSFRFKTYNFKHSEFV